MAGFKLDAVIDLFNGHICNPIIGELLYQVLLHVTIEIEILRKSSLSIVVLAPLIILDTLDNLFTYIGLVERDISSLAAVGDTDSIIRRLPKLSPADMDKTIIKTIEIMEINGLYESISRYTLMLHPFTHLFTCFH